VKVLHAAAWYPPHHLGGTEVYVAGLAGELKARGVETCVIKPWDGAPMADYEHLGVPVRAYAVGPERAAAQLAGIAPHAGFETFEALLRAERPDVYHQHSWTLGLGALHLAAAHDLGVRTVLTLHTPNPTCLRGTMMRLGRTPCDGRIETRRCAACWLEARGAPRPLLGALALTPAGARAAGHARGKREEFERMLASADRVVAVAAWLERALAVNGAPAEKVVLSRQGIDLELERALARCAAGPQTGPLRIGYLGRWHPTKGVEVLIRAVRALPADLPVRLTIRGLPLGPDEAAYEARQRRLAAGDPRIEILPPLARAEAPAVLKALDVLAVPSLWLETGPLVVLEAQAAGLAVLGSDAGGVAEFVAGGARDRLFPPGDVGACARAIAEMAAEVDGLRASRTPRRVRTMADVADDMLRVYQDLV
jgi:glycosyltransferase involved in cell wall biosynthesis